LKGSFRGGCKNDQRTGTRLLGGKAERVGSVQRGEGKGCRETFEQPASTRRGNDKA